MNRLLYFLLPALFLALAGCAVTGPEPEAVSEQEITRLPSETDGPAALDLSAPETAPEGVSCAGDVFTVTAAGTYRVTGSLLGQLAVDADGPVELILAGASIEGPEALCVRSNSAVRLTAEAGTGNTLYDGLEEPDEDASAAVWSKAPLTVGGEGSLAVLGGGNNGIQCKSTLTVEGGELTVRAVNNGLKAEGSVTVTGGTADITAGGDGIKAEAGRLAADDITVSGGALTISAAGRGLSAAGTAYVTDGSLDISAADDAVKGGALTVTGGTVKAASALDGIQAEGILYVAGGDLTVTAGEDGLRADNITFETGELSVEAGGDGLQADTVLVVSGGGISVTAGEDGLRADSVTVTGGDVVLGTAGDGMQGVSLAAVTGGTLSITAGGGGGNAINKAGDSFGPFMWNNSADTGSEISAKGIKSDGEIYIAGGVIGLDTDDDAVHAGTLLTIDGGALTIRASDDALHSDDMLIINDGTVNITDCFEGIEAFAMEVNGGDVAIRAVNDGINANGSEFGMFGGPWGWGRDQEAEADAEVTSLSGEATTFYRQRGGAVDIVITGTWGNVGDGIDSNGNVFIDGGVLTVSTLGNTQEGGIDTGRDGPIVTGGMVMAGGASMMQETWSDESTQCCAVIYVDLQPGGTPVTIYDENGGEIWSATLANPYNCIVLSHPGLLPGHVYTVDYGGGTETLDFTSSTNLRAGAGGWGGRGFGRW